LLYLSGKRYTSTLFSGGKVFKDLSVYLKFAAKGSRGGKRRKAQNFEAGERKDSINSISNFQEQNRPRAGGPHARRGGGGGMLL